MSYETLVQLVYEYEKQIKLKFMELANVLYHYVSSEPIDDFNSDVKYSDDITNILFTTPHLVLQFATITPSDDDIELYVKFNGNRGMVRYSEMVSYTVQSKQEDIRILIDGLNGYLVHKRNLNMWSKFKQDVHDTPNKDGWDIAHEERVAKDEELSDD